MGDALEELMEREIKAYKERYLKNQARQPLVLTDPEEIRPILLRREEAKEAKRSKLELENVQAGLKDAWVEIKALRKLTDSLDRTVAADDDLNRLGFGQVALWICWAASAIAIVVLFVR